jgi:ribosomal RNA-processing protein 7
LAKAAELGAAAQKKERGAADFYRAQKREKERDRLLQLRQGFVEDQKRVQQLRAARRFKPT